MGFKHLAVGLAAISSVAVASPAGPRNDKPAYPSKGTLIVGPLVSTITVVDGTTVTVAPQLSTTTIFQGTTKRVGIVTVQQTPKPSTRTQSVHGKGTKKSTGTKRKQPVKRNVTEDDNEKSESFLDTIEAFLKLDKSQMNSLVDAAPIFAKLASAYKTTPDDEKEVVRSMARNAYGTWIKPEDADDEFDFDFDEEMKNMGKLAELIPTLSPKELQELEQGMMDLISRMPDKTIRKLKTTDMKSRNAAVELVIKWARDKLKKARKARKNAGDRLVTVMADLPPDGHTSTISAREAQSTDGHTTTISASKTQKAQPRGNDTHKSKGVPDAFLERVKNFFIEKFGMAEEQEYAEEELVTIMADLPPDGHTSTISARGVQPTESVDSKSHLPQWFIEKVENILLEKFGGAEEDQYAEEELVTIMADLPPDGHTSTISARAVQPTESVDSKSHLPQWFIEKVENLLLEKFGGAEEQEYAEEELVTIMVDLPPDGHTSTISARAAQPTESADSERRQLIVPFVFPKNHPTDEQLSSLEALGTSVTAAPLARRKDKSGALRLPFGYKNPDAKNWQKTKAFKDKDIKYGWKLGNMCTYKDSKDTVLFKCDGKESS